MLYIEIPATLRRTNKKVQIPTDWHELSTPDLLGAALTHIALHPPDSNVEFISLAAILAPHSIRQIPIAFMPTKYTDQIAAALVDMYKVPPINHTSPLAGKQVLCPITNNIYQYPKPFFAGLITRTFTNATMSRLLDPNPEMSRVGAAVAHFVVTPPPQEQPLLRRMWSKVATPKPTTPPTYTHIDEPAPFPSPVQWHLFEYLRQTYADITKSPLYKHIFPPPKKEDDDDDDDNDNDEPAPIPPPPKYNHRDWFDNFMQFAQIPHNGIGDIEKVMQEQLVAVLRAYDLLLKNTPKLETTTHHIPTQNNHK